MNVNTHLNLLIPTNKPSSLQIIYRRLDELRLDRSSPLETLIPPRGTDGSNPASSSEESLETSDPIAFSLEFTAGRTF
jgi:hypothetical protein